MWTHSVTFFFLYEADQSPDHIMSPSEVELLPGLDGICNELLREDGYGFCFCD